MKSREIEKHQIAVKKLEKIRDKAFNFIRANLKNVSEWDVQNFILKEFKKENLVTDEKYPVQIIAANENTAIVHYFPKKETAKIIKKNSLVLIDLWAKLEEKGAPFADITWIGFCGEEVPKDIKKIFKTVIGARDFAINFIKDYLKKRRLPKTKIVEIAVRNYLRKFGHEEFFPHGLGHSLGFAQCHGKYFRFGKKSNAKIKPNIPFTIEPGIYFKGKFGIRSEIDCYITEDYKLIITTEVQKEILKI
jgi:Xaa-Pro aminopeptidase